METIEEMIAKLRVNKSKPMHQQGVTREFLHDVADELEQLLEKPARQPQRFCKDCRHYRPEGKFQDLSQQIEFAKCARPEYLELVGGRAGTYCSTLRKYDCGAAGDLWEPKPVTGLEHFWMPPSQPRSWWQFWK